jgi:hypothetical protein
MFMLRQSFAHVPTNDCVTCGALTQYNHSFYDYGGAYSLEKIMDLLAYPLNEHRHIQNLRPCKIGNTYKVTGKK